MSSKDSTIGMPNEAQRRHLGTMLHRAFVDIRILARNGDTDQAADLADAFHNIPTFMFSEDFDWSVARRFLETYENMYSNVTGHWPFDYVNSLDKIQRGEDID